MTCQSFFAGEILSNAIIGVVKISTLLLLTRIFPGQKFKRTLWAVALFILIYSAIMVITTFFQCRPLTKFWDSTIRAECIDITKVWIIVANLNVLTNLLLLCVPLPELQELQTHHGTELQLIGILGIGGLSVTQHSLTYIADRGSNDIFGKSAD